MTSGVSREKDIQTWQLFAIVFFHLKINVKSYAIANPYKINFLDMAGNEGFKKLSTSSNHPLRKYKMSIKIYKG